MIDRKEVVERLEALDLSAYEDSHGRLSVICEVVSDPNCGWTLGACEVLRERLIYLLGGVGDDADACDRAGRGVRAADGHADGDGQPSKTALMAEYHRGFVDGCKLRETATWQLSMERDGVVRRLRKLNSENFRCKQFMGDLLSAIDPDWISKASMYDEATLNEYMRDRLIHLLGGDLQIFRDKWNIRKGSESASADRQSCPDRLKGETYDFVILDELGGMSENAQAVAKPNSQKSPILANSDGKDGGEVTITDELRKWVKSLYTPNSDELKAEGYRIADRIDEQAKSLEHDVEMWRDRAEDMRMERDSLESEISEQKSLAEGFAPPEWYEERVLDMEKERDELQAKLDEYDKTHVALPKDANGEYIHIGDVMDGYGKTIEVVELRYGRSGWVLISRDGNGYSDIFAFAHHHEPTVEQVIRDLMLGKITESQAIERIEAL